MRLVRLYHFVPASTHLTSINIPTQERGNEQNEKEMIINNRQLGVWLFRNCGRDSEDGVKSGANGAAETIRSIGMAPYSLSWSYIEKPTYTFSAFSKGIPFRDMHGFFQSFP